MIARVVVLLGLIGVPAHALAQPAVLSEDVTDEYQLSYRYYHAFIVNLLPDQLVNFENQLRGRVASNWYKEDMTERLEWVQQQGWSQEFKAMFVRTVKWRRETFDGGADKLYRLSKKYQKVPNAEKYGYVALSGDLLGRAAIAGHAKAMKEVLDHPASVIWPPILGMNRRVHYPGAASGQFTGRVLLALNYLNHPIFDDDRTKGFYWYLRLPKSQLTDKLSAMLSKNLVWVSPEQRSQAQSWIKSGHVPPM